MIERGPYDCRNCGQSTKYNNCKFCTNETWCDNCERCNIGGNHFEDRERIRVERERIEAEAKKLGCTVESIEMLEKLQREKKEEGR